MLTLSCLRFLRLPLGFLPSLLLLLLLSALELPLLLLAPLGPCPLVLPILSLLDTAASDSVRDRVLRAQQQQQQSVSNTVAVSITRAVARDRPHSTRSLLYNGNH
jgi:hypothetical protein